MLENFHTTFNMLARESLFNFITIFILSMVWVFNTMALIAVGLGRMYFGLGPVVITIVKKYWRITVLAIMALLTAIAYVAFCIGLSLGISSPMEEWKWVFYIMACLVLMVLGIAWVQEKMIQKQAIRTYAPKNDEDETTDNTFNSIDHASSQLAWSEDRCYNCGSRLIKGEEPFGLCIECSIPDPIKEDVEELHLINVCPACGKRGTFDETRERVDAIWHSLEKGWMCVACCDGEVLLQNEKGPHRHNLQA